MSGLRVGACLALGLVGCQADLLPGELVLGDEIRAIERFGQAGSQFGAAVAVGEAENGAVIVLVAAPGAGVVHALDRQGKTVWTASGTPGFGTRLGWAGTLPWAWQPSVGVVALGGEETPAAWLTPQASAVDVCPDGSLRVRKGRGEAVLCSDALEARIQCAQDTCVVERLEGDSWVEVGTTSAGSALSETASGLCWGDARLGKETAPGSVRCEAGATVQGMGGDHIGLEIAGDRAAGVFNRHITPPRARIVSRGSGQVWVVDRAAERSRITLSGGADLFVVGVPGFGAQEAEEGQVFIVENVQNSDDGV